MRHVFSAAMFVVIYDPSAADDLIEFVSRQGYRASKRTPFVVHIDPSGRDRDVERVFAEWHGTRDEIAAELISPARLTRA